MPAMQELLPVSVLLEEARSEVELTQLDLWLAYRDLGGSASLSTVEEWLRGNREPKVSQYNLLAFVLNKRAGELGLMPKLPLLGRFVNPTRPADGIDDQMS